MHVSLESGHYLSSIILPFFSELTGQNVSVLLVLFSSTQYTFLIQTLFTHGLVKLLAGFFAAAEDSVKSDFELIFPASSSLQVALLRLDSE